MKRIVNPSLFNLNNETDFYNCGEHGNCFHAAFVVFLQLYVNNANEHDFEGARLCHGAVKLLSEDRMIIHGWTEARFTGVEDILVFDSSAVGQPMTIATKQQYYRHSKTKDEYVSKYDLGEFMEITKHTEHTGIWEHPRTAVSDVIDGSKLIARKHWKSIRSKRGSIGKENWVSCIAELIARLHQQELSNA